MDRKRTLRLLCLLLPAALALAGTAVRAAAMFVSLDRESGYFNKGPLPVLCGALGFLGVAASIVCAALLPKDSLPGSLPSRLFPDLSAGVGFLASAVWGACAAGARLSAQLPTLLAFGAVLYFGLAIARSRRGCRLPEGLCAAGCLPLFWAFSLLASTYTDLRTPMNWPVKTALQFGFLGVMIVMPAELRFRLGKPQPRVAAACFGVAACLCLAASVPCLAAAAAGILPGPLPVYAAPALAGMGLFALGRLAALTGPAAG